MFFFDPEYVNEKRVPGFDPHLDIAKLAGFLTEEEEIIFKEKSDEQIYKKVKDYRQTAKGVNFSATYGAGPAKIAETAKIPLKEGKRLHEIYWNRNSAIKKTAKALTVKTVNGQDWVYNPVAKFWYFLKEEKDKFSTLNQGTGVFVFDTWLRFVRQSLQQFDCKVLYQYHDELMFICNKTDQERIENILFDCIKLANEKLQLNIEIGISVDWGNNYAECH